MILVPIWIDKHWTSISIDTVKKHIRYLDIIYKGGSEIFRRIKRWLREQRERFHTEPPPEWRTLPSTHGTTPRQHDDHSCGFYQLMFMWRFANGRTVEAVGSRSVEAAQGMIATGTWKGCLPNDTQRKVHWELPDGQTVAGCTLDDQAEGESNLQNNTGTERNQVADTEEGRRQETC